MAAHRLCPVCGKGVIKARSRTTCSTDCGYKLRRHKYYTSIGEAVPPEDTYIPPTLRRFAPEAPAVAYETKPPEPLIAPPVVNGSVESPWQKPAEIPSAVVNAPADEDAGLVVPRSLRPKERAPENQSSVPFLPRAMFVDSDNHFPIADPYVTAAKLAFVRDRKPDLWVNLGDLLDFWLASRFPKEAKRLFGSYQATLQGEIDSARPYVEAVCSIVKQAHWIPGNHEKRHETLIDANPSQYGLRALGWKNILEFPENFVTHPYGTRLKINRAPLYCVHGDQIVPERVVDPAGYMLNRRVNQTTLFGHTHRAAQQYRTGYDENRAPIIYGAVNTGHGSLVSEQTYAGPEPSWQHAFAYVEFYEDEGKARFSTHLITVIDGKFSWDGTLYGKSWQ